MKRGGQSLISGALVVATTWMMSTSEAGTATPIVHASGATKVMGDKEDREPSGRRRIEPIVTSLGEGRGPQGAWRAQLIEDAIGARLKFVIRDQLYTFHPQNTLETYNTSEIVTLTGNRTPLFVTQWNSGRGIRLYVINPALYPRNRQAAVLWSEFFDGIIEIGRSEEGTSLRILYMHMVHGPPAVDQVHAEYEEKVRVWRPDH